jgi:hypothetical protein
MIARSDDRDAASNATIGSPDGSSIDDPIDRQIIDPQIIDSLATTQAQP